LTEGTPLLAARGAGRKFGRKSALEAVELELWAGDALALVGPNGAGKSTLLALLAGALEASAGKVERRKGLRVGWAPQRPAQYGRLSARENLELFARL
jgi:ABC-type multidrug transport system ATPase subunit